MPTGRRNAVREVGLCGAPLPLFGDESYQDAPAHDFENSRAAAVVSFAQGVGLVTRDGDAALQRPTDFGFLMERHSSTACNRNASRSRSPTPLAMRLPRGVTRESRSPGASAGRKKITEPVSPTPWSGVSARAAAAESTEKEVRPRNRRSGRTAGASTVAQTAAQARPLALSEHVPSSGFDRTMICKFWLKNRCSRKDDCKFAHGEAQQRAACASVPCRHFREGSCRQGPDCWFSHDMELKGGEIVAPALGMVDMEAESTAASEDVMPTIAEVPRVAFDPTPIARRQRSEPIVASGPSPTDKTLLCKFFQKGRCSKKVDCKFAHTEEEQRHACGALMCGHFVKHGRCRKGAACWYRHSEVPADEAPVQRAAPVQRKRAPAALQPLVSQRVGSASASESPRSQLCHGPSPSTLPTTPSLGPERDSRRRWSDICSDDDDDLNEFDLTPPGGGISTPHDIRSIFNFTEALAKAA